MKTKTFKSSIDKTKWLFISALCCLLFMISSCNNQEEQRRRNELNDMDTYVKAHINSTEKYMDKKWEDMQKEFDEKKAKLDKDMDKMNKEMKESYDRNVAEWDTYKSNYIAMKERRAEKERVKDFKQTLLYEGIDIDLDNINALNIANEYEHFVNKVDDNKEAYTKEEWIIVNDFWKKLNDKKDALDDQITKKDSKKITGLKIKYSTIKVLNKPFAGSGEHS